MIQNIINAETGTPQGDYCLAPDVILLLLQDGTARLLDVGGNFYAIPQTGALMLQETLREGHATAAHTIATIYNVKLQQVENDLQAFLHDLEKRKLIYCQGKTPPSYKAIMPSFVLLPLLCCIHAWSASMKTRAWALLTLAYLSVRLFGWPRTVMVWQGYYRKHATSAPICGVEPAARVADEATRTMAARHPFRIECKERALCCWALLHSIGIPARLVVGISLFPLASHCWCELGGLVLSDDIDRCECFTPVLSYE